MDDREIPDCRNITFFRKIQWISYVFSVNRLYQKIRHGNLSSKYPEIDVIDPTDALKKKNPWTHTFD